MSDFWKRVAEKYERSQRESRCAHGFIRADQYCLMCELETQRDQYRTAMRERMAEAARLDANISVATRGIERRLAAMKIRAESADHEVGYKMAEIDELKSRLRTAHDSALEEAAKIVSRAASKACELIDEGGYGSGWDEDQLEAVDSWLCVAAAEIRALKGSA